MYLSTQKPTKDEHFVPRGYLKLFSVNPYVKKPMIYQIDVTEETAQKLVSIKSICYEQNLYEIFNNDGAIVAPNLIEKTLKQYEDAFYICRNNIISSWKIRSPQAFLSDIERQIITTTLALQMLRYKDVIDGMTEIVNMLNSAQNSNQFVVNFSSLLMLFPIPLIFANITMTKEMRQLKRWATNPPVFDRFKRGLSDNSFCLGHIETNEILTCDRPVVLRTADPYTIDFIVYPLSPRHVLFIYSPGTIFPHSNNSYFLMTPSEVQFVNEAVYLNAKRWVYNGNKLNEDVIAEFKQKRIDLTKRAIKKHNSWYLL